MSVDSDGIVVDSLIYSPIAAKGSWTLNVSKAFWVTQKTHVIIGLSGSGKSTLLKILMGLIKAQKGTATLPPHLQSIGYVIQEGGLFPHLTVDENILLPFRSASPLTRNRISPRFKPSELTPLMILRRNEMLDLVALSPSLLKRFPHELSGGQRQRVGLARALILNPNLILLDEPLSALDPLTKWDLQRDLKDIFNRLKKTVMLVTHDINEALFFGHTITVMDQGQIIQSASDQDILDRPANEFVRRLMATRSGGPR